MLLIYQWWFDGLAIPCIDIDERRRKTALERKRARNRQERKKREKSTKAYHHLFFEGVCLYVSDIYLLFLYTLSLLSSSLFRSSSSVVCICPLPFAIHQCELASVSISLSVTMTVFRSTALRCLHSSHVVSCRFCNKRTACISFSPSLFSTRSKALQSYRLFSLLISTYRVMVIIIHLLTYKQTWIKYAAKNERKSSPLLDYRLIDAQVS